MEDEDDLRDVIRKILELDDHDVITAANGWEGVRMLEEIGADLILTDAYMPDVGGIELVVRLRHLNESVPVIVMSGGGWEDKTEVLERARAEGAAATLEKPFDVRTLRRLVRRLLPPEAG
ncbi:MAG: response regulator [Longimicrobiales bacterium]|nr:response regulator [Longimicrobiales bacterium]